MKNALKKRILCVLLTLALVLGNIPVTALAEEPLLQEEVSEETLPEIAEETLSEAEEETVSESEAAAETAAAGEPVLEVMEESLLQETAETLLGPVQPDTAEEDETDTFCGGIPFQLNPLYEGLVDPADYENWEPEFIAPSTYADVEYLTEEKAAEQIRAYMCARVESFTVTFAAGKEYVKADFTALMEQALSHTGNPIEGDYLRWQYAGWEAGYSCSVSDGIYRYTVNITIPYYTTAEQEEELDVAVEQLLNQLNLSGKRDYEKIKGIYDYICKNVTYDHANLNDDSYKLKFTAYAALIQGTAVCQGYSVLLYRLALTLGIDCRFVGGTGNGGGHGWNIVKLDDRYYNADATWDAGRTQYQYFLTGSSFDNNHTRDAEYTTEAFNAAYPMATEDYVPATDVPAVIASGTCGDALTWTLSNGGVLTISGTGEMENYGYYSKAPWYSYRLEITSVSVKNGVTSIGCSAFNACNNITSVAIPASVTTIGAEAFYLCTSLTSVAISEGVTSIGHYAFNNCTSLASVIIPVSVTAIDSDIFTGCTGLSMITYNGTTEQWMAMDYRFPAKCINGTIWDWGSCIRDLSYILDGNGVLAITGSGTTISYSRPENIPWYAYRAQIKEVTLPDGITRVGTNVFYDCVNLESISIPDGVETIGNSTFYRCSSLKSIRFPSTLQTIGDDAFTECTSLTEVRIPVSVTAIGDAAFCHCTSLTEITFEHAYNSQLSIGHGAFSPYDDGSYGLPDPPINMATMVYVPARLDINPAIRNYPWAGTSGCSRAVTYVSMASGISVGTTGDYHNEVAVGQSIPMVAEVDGVEDSTVTWWWRTAPARQPLIRMVF